MWDITDGDGDDFCCVTGCAACEEKFDPFALVVVAGHLVYHFTKVLQKAAKTVHVAADELSDVIDAHARWRRRRQHFAENVNATIEQLDCDDWDIEFIDDAADAIRDTVSERQWARHLYECGDITREDYHRRIGLPPIEEDPDAGQ